MRPVLGGLLLTVGWARIEAGARVPSLGALIELADQLDTSAARGREQSSGAQPDGPARLAPARIALAPGRARRFALR